MSVIYQGAVEMQARKWSLLLSWCLPASACLLLTACTSEPSEPEMANAVIQRVTQMAGPMGSMVELIEFKS